MKISHLISNLLLFISFGLFAQQSPPQGINYQAVALDYEKSEIPGINLEAKPLMNETITLRFTIIKDSENGASTYIETNEVETDENGLFNTIIGQGNIDANSPQNFQDIDWGTGFHFLKVEIDIKQDGNFKDMGTNQLWSVPYSLYSKTAANGISSITDNGDGTLTFTYLDGSQYITPVLTGLTGPQGPQGDQGPDGRNAYEIWLDQGNVGDTLTFLASIKGEDGNGITSTTDNGDGTFTFTYTDGSTFTTSDLTGPTGPAGSNGTNGTDGADGNGIASTTDNGDGTFTFTYTDGSTFTTSDLTGPQGPQGIQGLAGATGPAGSNGTNGTNGADGNGITSTTDNGDGTFTFTYDDGTTFTSSDLTGPQGPQGLQGPAGVTGPAGSNGTNGTDGADGNGIASTRDNGDGTFTFTYDDGTTFTISDLTGPQGPQGLQGPAGATGPAGSNGTNGTDGNGITSTTDNGDGTFTFTYDDGTTFTTSDLTGPQGPQGLQGPVGATGPDGSNGTNGANGTDGNGIVSTTDNGDGTFTFTYTDGSTFTTSDLTGPQGPQGIQGLAGATGPAGSNGTNGTDGNGIASTTDNGDGTFTFTYDDGTTFTTSDLTGPQGPQGMTGSAGNVPTGSVISYVGIAAPAGWAICDGSELDRNLESNLFNIIGVSFGVGDGFSTFNLPDLRGRFIRGTDNGSGNDPDAISRTSINGGNVGDNIGSYQADQFKSHNHSLIGRKSVGGSGNRPSVTSGGVSNVNIPYVGNNGGTETRPKNISFNFIIKL